MDKAEKEMEEIQVEVGECIFDHEKNIKYQPCYKCGKGFVDHVHPSPHDLNALIDYAEKLGHTSVYFDTHKDGHLCILSNKSETIEYGDSEADALRSALVQAIRRSK